MILGISDYTAREGYLCRYSVEHFFGEASRGNHFLSYYRAASEVEPRLAKRRKLRRLSQLRSPQDADWLNERMSIAIARHIPPESGLELSVRIVPIHNLHVETPQVRKMIWIMFFLGIVLLFTTALNYVLVSVASLTQRAKAIGVHKCSGASGSSIFPCSW